MSEQSDVCPAKHQSQAFAFVVSVWVTDHPFCTFHLADCADVGVPLCQDECCARALAAPLA